MEKINQNHNPGMINQQQQQKQQEQKQQCCQEQEVYMQIKQQKLEILITHSKHVLKCKEEIVGQFHKPYLGKLKKAKDNTFRGRSLVNWLFQNYNPDNIDIKNKKARQLMIQWILENLMNPQLPFQLIYPYNIKKKNRIKDNDYLYRFVDDQYLIYQKKKYVLNIIDGTELSSQPPFFWTKEYQNHQILQQPNLIVKDIRIQFMHLKMQAMDEKSSSVDYTYLGNMKEFTENLFNKLQMLSFINVDILAHDHNEKTAFFINLYNILTLHSIILFGKEKGHYNITTSERVSFYTKYSYNIGGNNYTLDDIEHGVLRNNDSIGKNQALKFWKIITSQTLSDKNTPRFNIYDPRTKIAKCTQQFDPRIHFTLNCGVKSCPPIKVYTPQKLESQFKTASRNFMLKNIEILYNEKKNFYTINCSKLLQWYRGDFGKNMLEVFEYLEQYAQDKQKPIFDKLIRDAKNIKYKIVFIQYDWTVNHKQKDMPIQIAEEGDNRKLIEQNLIQSQKQQQQQFLSSQQHLSTNQQQQQIDIESMKKQFVNQQSITSSNVNYNIDDENVQSINNALQIKSKSYVDSKHLLE